MQRIIIILLFFLFPLFSSFSQTRGLRIQAKTLAGDHIPLYNNSYALVIGVSDYSNGWPKLPSAVSDARDVAKELEQRNFNVSLVLNPSKVELEEKLNDFIFTYGSDENDRLLIYFAGHGYTMDMAYGSKMGFIVPVDAPLPHVNNIEFRRKSISMEVFEHHARQIQSKHVLYLFDSCFSGSIFTLSRAVPSAISYKTAKPVRQFITAGDEGEEVPDKSIFKSQFINGLKGEADTNNDGYITGTELGEFLQVSVVNYSRESQHPQYGKIRDPKLDKGDFVFFISDKSKLTDWSYSEWEDYTNDMKDKFTQISNKSKNNEISDEQEISEWENFLVTYAKDNPHSSQDNQMRDFARDKKFKSSQRQQLNVDNILNDDGINNKNQRKTLTKQKKLNNLFIFFDVNKFISNIELSYDIESSPLFYCINFSLRVKPKLGFNVKYGYLYYQGEEEFFDLLYKVKGYNHLILAGPIIFLSETLFLNVNAGIAIEQERITILAEDNYTFGRDKKNWNSFVINSSLMFNISSKLYVYPSITYWDGRDFSLGIGLGYGF